VIGSAPPPVAYGNAARGSSSPAPAPAPAVVAPSAPARSFTGRAVEDPSLSLPIAARRPWGLIIAVLLIDVGLAVAGGWLLSHGLGDKPSASLESSSHPTSVAT
jgi:hypothetical protein